MATIKRKKKYLKKQAPVVTPDIFEIEKNPPSPRYSKWNPERDALIKKVDATLETLKIGEAFIIDTTSKNTVSAYLAKEYATERWSYITIPDNPDKVRVYRLAYTKKA